jgi:alpha-soluble NSF attachment protein
MLKKHFKKDKYKCTIELYIQAAKQYKKSKDKESMANAYIKAAEIAKNNVKDINSAIHLYIKSVKQYKYIDPYLADDIYNMTIIPLLIETSNFRTIAKCYKDLAELWEKEEDTSKSYKYLIKAKDVYDTEGYYMSSLLCMIKCADILCNQSKYEKAIKQLEYIVQYSIQHNVNKHICKDYLGKSLICQLCVSSLDNDINIVENSMDKYCEILPSFEHHPIYEFVKNIVIAYKNNDVDKYVKLCMNYDKQYKLDNWTASSLLLVKNMLEQDIDLS